MSDNLKPCRWVKYMSHHIETETEPVCKHPLAIHLAGGLPPECHGCPCHEPQPDPTPTGKAGHDKP